MSVLGSMRGLSLTSSFIKLNLSNLVGQSSAIALGPTMQVRTATKKVAGSRTNMRDSAGRRLGAKAAENEPVKTGQILMRQRGTKFYPGENCAIGKDHTIYALEPGYVRFYLDPFHPKRKFVGVALAPELRLPTPHFEPRVRRLGYVAIEDDFKAEFEEGNLPRKDHLRRPQILKDLKERQVKREERSKQYVEQLKSLVPELNESELEQLSERFLFVRTQFKNGVTLPDAQATITSIYFQNLKLQRQKELITEEELTKLKEEYLTLTAKIDKLVSFDNKYNLINYISESDRSTKVEELEAEVEALSNGKKDKKTREQVSKLIFGSGLLNTKERKYFISKYLKTVLPETVGLGKANDKKVTLFKRWNYEKQRIDVIPRSKEAFFK